MRHNFYGEHLNVALKPLSMENLEALRKWRNNKNQTKFLRPIGNITPEMQMNWFKSYLDDQRAVNFGIYETEKLNRFVGSLSIYDIDDNRAEIGKIQIGDDEAHGMGIGRTSLIIAMKIGFELIGLTEIYASVHQDNVAARTNDLRIGFKIVGNHPSCVGGFEDEIVIHLDELYSANPNVDKIKIYTGESK